MSTDTCTGTRTRTEVALERLDKGAGTQLDVSDLFHADPTQLRVLVAGWQASGPVRRFRELLEREGTLHESKEYLSDEPSWTVVLFLTLHAAHGQDAAAWLATRRRSFA